VSVLSNPAFTALIGAAVGGLITEARQFLETHRERRKAVSRMLWCQLDLWYELKRFDLSDLLSAFIERLSSSLGVSVEQLAAFLPDVPGIARIVGTVAGVRDPDLTTRYQTAVGALSFFDPLLAYRLSGKAHNEPGGRQADELIRQFTELYSTQAESEGEMAAILTPILRDEMVRAQIKAIEEDIQEVAGVLGRRIQKRAAKALASLQAQLNEERSASLTHAVDRCIEMLRRVHEQHVARHGADGEPTPSSGETQTALPE
jgi:hypothetical protein